jgi:hypothetical protein
MNTKERIKKILELEGFYKSSHLIVGRILESFKDPILQSKAQKHFNFEEIVEKIVPLYESEFSDEELDSIITFYNSTEGKKILEFKQTSNFKINEILKEWMAEKQKAIMKDLSKG